MSVKKANTRRRSTIPDVVWVDIEEDEDDNEFRIVLLGKTGSGKSSVGNSILNKTRKTGFYSACGQTAATISCQRKSVRINRRKIRVIDTPGVCDPVRDEKEVAHEISRCLAMCTPGPHALLFVVNAHGRFTKEEYEAYVTTKTIFNDSISKYAIVVFTHGDDLFEEDKSIGMILQEAAKVIDSQKKNRGSKGTKIADIRVILRDVSNRHILFNNRGDDKTKRKQIHDLIQMIEQMVSDNGDMPYFSDDLTKAVWQETEEELTSIMRIQKVDRKKAWKIHQDRIKKRENPPPTKKTSDKGLTSSFKEQCSLESRAIPPSYPEAPPSYSSIFSSCHSNPQHRPTYHSYQPVTNFVRVSDLQQNRKGDTNDFVERLAAGTAGAALCGAGVVALAATAPISLPVGAAVAAIGGVVSAASKCTVM